MLRACPNMTLGAEWCMKTQTLKLACLCISGLFLEKLTVYQINYPMFMVPKFNIHINGYIRLEQSISRNGIYVSKNVF